MIATSEDPVMGSRKHWCKRGGSGSPGQNLVLQLAEFMLKAGILWWDGFNNGGVPANNIVQSHFLISHLQLCVVEESNSC